MSDVIFIGSDYKQGDFQPIGDIGQSDVFIGLPACLYKPIDSETPITQGITIYGYCSVFENAEIKVKKDGKWEQINPEDQLVKFDLVAERIEKTSSRGTKYAKEPGTATAYFHQLITSHYKEGEIFSLRLNFGEATASVIKSLETGKSAKGRNVDPDTLAEWKESLISWGKADDERKELLEKADYGTNNGYSKTKGSYKAIAPKDKLDSVINALSINHPEIVDFDSLVLFLLDLEQKQAETYLAVITAICQ